MDAVHSTVPITRTDRELMKRFTVIALFLLFLTAAFSHLFRFYTRRLEDFTGPARWIWASHQISRNVPVVFFATREFDLPKTRAFAHVKIFADPEYVLWFNGRELAGRRAGDDARNLDMYDVSALARTGPNRILVAVRSTNGVGGLIASVDTGVEQENVVVTDNTWKIYRQWNDALPLHDTAPAQRPMILGEPPLGRWHYLTPKPANIDPAVSKIVKPFLALTYRATIPTVKIVDGVAVAVKEPVRATAFDFGFTSGRVRLTLEGHQPVPPVVKFRLANVREELNVTESTIWSTPFAAGERSITEPDRQHFRYVIVFGGRATAEVVQ